MDIVTAGVLLVIAGLAIVAVAMLSQRGEGRTEVRGGGVLMIGPIPLIFGSDAKWASVAIVLAIVLMILYFLWVI